MLIKTPLLHQSFGPSVFPSSLPPFLPSSFSLPPFLPFFSFSLSLWLIPWSAEARWAHFLAWASKTLTRRHTVPSPTWEGAWCLRAAARALRTRLYWLSSETRGHQPLSLSYSLTRWLRTTRFQSTKGSTSGAWTGTLVHVASEGVTPRAYWGR